MPTVLKVFLSPKQPDTGSLSLDLTSLEIKLTKSEVWKIQWSDNTATTDMCYTYYNTAVGLYPVGELVPVETSEGYVTWLYCQKKTATRSRDNSAVFNMVVEYASPPITMATSGKSNFVIDVDSEDYKIDVWKDRKNNPVCNSFGSPFDPTLQKDFGDERITIDFVSTAIDTANIDACRRCVNSGSVTLSIAALGYVRTFPERGLKLARARYSSEIQGPGSSGQPPAWKVHYEFLKRSQLGPDGNTYGFTEFVQDQGIQYFDSNNNVAANVVNGIAEPVLLDGNGHILKQADPSQSGAPGNFTSSLSAPISLPGGTASSNAIWRAFEIEDEASFDGLFEGIE